MIEGLDLPSWLTVGTPPQWILLGVVVVGWLKVWPVVRQQNIDFTAAAKAAYETRIEKVENKLKECEENCAAQEVRLKEEVDLLKTKLNNEAWQRVQSEISLVNTLIQVLPNEQLKIILEALQKRSALMPSALTAIGGPVEDEKGAGK